MYNKNINNFNDNYQKETWVSNLTSITLPNDIIGMISLGSKHSFNKNSHTMMQL